MNFLEALLAKNKEKKEIKEVKPKATKTHAPAKNKVHIVTWSPDIGNFWCKELPYTMSDDAIYKWLNANITAQCVKIFRGKEIVIRGKRK